jgi:hypothetical protein
MAWVLPAIRPWRETRGSATVYGKLPDAPKHDSLTREA